MMESPPTPPPLAAAVADAHREVELKLHVPAAALARLRTHPLVVESAIGPWKVARLDSRYFDTIDRDLARRGLALRLRRSGRTWSQTLKASGDADGALSARREWETPVPGPALQLARLSDTPLSTVASTRSLARRLRPIFTTDFRRESRRLRLPDGSEVEFAIDTGWIRSGRGRTRRSLPIGEVEIESKTAGTGDVAAALLRFARRLARDVPSIPLAASKAARGHRLADGGVVEPTRVVLPTPRGPDRANVHLALVTKACGTALLDNAHALLASDPTAESVDPEFVHQARVAIRRLRSAFRTFRPIAKGRRFDAVEEGLRSLGHAFGRARDWDVFAATTLKRIADRIAADDAGRAALADLVARVESRRSEAYRALRAQLDEGPFGALALDLMRLAVALDDDAARPAPTLDACVPRWLDDQRARIVRRSRRIAILDDEERHGLRVEVKRLRYALDLFGPLYEAALVDDFRETLSELQTKLGRINDEVVAERLLRSFDHDASGGVLAARYAAWLGPHIRKQLPKVAALSVAFELARAPWSRDPARPFG